MNDNSTKDNNDTEKNEREKQVSSRSSNLVVIIIMAIILVLAVILAAFFIFGRGQEPAEATPAPTNTQVVDPVWDKIQSEGRLVVGTAANYPPFEFYDDDFQLDGLDIAIIQEIGRRLGLEVELRDLAFDGLGNALAVEQIDLAISAITVTADRRQLVDFSNVYYVSSDAIIASADSLVANLSSPEEIGQLKLGVESGTIYEDWAQTSLIEAGLMAPSDLFTYKQIDDAISDLLEQRIDLVAMDLQPAELAASTGQSKIVARSLNHQQFAMAMPKGARGLLSEVNRVLFEMQGDGTLPGLVTQYIGLEAEEIQSLPSPQPPAEGQPPVGKPVICIDSAEFVSHLNYDHEDFSNIPAINPGEQFQKGWRMRNSGTCTWNKDYLLAPTGGNISSSTIGGGIVPVEGEVAPGETYDFWADLVAPIVPGEYVGHWSMRNNSSGLLFGEQVGVAVEVVEAPTPTPLPTQTPVPGISFAASPEVIQQGQCSSLTWSTENIQAVYVYEQGEDWRTHGVQGAGSLLVCPNATTTYELRVILNDGSVEIRQVTVFVAPDRSIPQIIRFTVEPPDQIAQGQCVTIQWIVEGNVDSVRIERNGVTIWPNAPFSGAMQDCPPSVGQQIYALVASGPGGNSQANWVINVVGTATPFPTSTATVAANTPTPSTEPIIYYFTATPQQIQVNQCVTLSWNVGGNASRVSIRKNSVTIQENVSFHSSWSDCSTSSMGTTIYSLVATSRFNQTATSQQTVDVLP